MNLTKVGRVRKGNGSSWLKPGDEVAAAQKKCAKNLGAVWRHGEIDAPPKKRPMDSDDVVEEVERKGFSNAHHNVDFLEPVDPDVCLGVMCPKRSDDCDGCHLSSEQIDRECSH